MIIGPCKLVSDVSLLKTPGACWSLVYAELERAIVSMSIGETSSCLPHRLYSSVAGVYIASRTLYQLCLVSWQHSSGCDYQPRCKQPGPRYGQCSARCSPSATSHSRSPAPVDLHLAADKSLQSCSTAITVFYRKIALKAEKCLPLSMSGKTGWGIRVTIFKDTQEFCTLCNPIAEAGRGTQLA